VYSLHVGGFVCVSQSTLAFNRGKTQGDSFRTRFPAIAGSEPRFAFQFRS
jgi:hypothetical protein